MIILIQNNYNKLKIHIEDIFKNKRIKIIKMKFKNKNKNKRIRNHYQYVLQIILFI